MEIISNPMMVLVDTTVWIDFFSGHNIPQVTLLEKIIRDGDDICTCGPVLTEVLQGIRFDKDYEQTKVGFESFLFLPMNKTTFVLAAEMFRHLRRKGITIRKPIDCMIAAVAIEYEVPLLHNDKDFIPFTKHFGMRVFE